ncbi:hypothetical protein OsI_34625 [Oryza sativa Indica Group]|nr:hypothetical protein OsI_34625 [Oryza sativa Indica Group]
MAEARTIGSISVPNVQELAGTCNGIDEEIPERYIRPEVSSDEVIKNNHGDMSIPIIDLDKLISPQSSQEECVKLISACQYWGFFQLINHGVPDEVIANLKNDLVEFFSQPLDAKKEYSQLPNNLEGYGQAFVVSDNQKLDWADMLYLQVCPTDSRDLRFWPNYPASFRHSIDAYSSETENIGLCLLQFMAKAVGVEPKSLLSVFEGQARGLRMNYYPPCLKADKVLGLSPHTDPGGLTLLLQVNDVQGLQINKDGKWFSVNALNGALIVNIGDTLELINHGVPDEVIANLKNDLVEFFSQPLDAKKEYSQLPNNLEGYGQAFVVSDNQKLDWADMLYLQVCPTDSRDLRFWPNYPASFRHSIDAYSSETENIGLCLLQFMAKAVGVEPKSLLSVFEGQARGLRMNYYPPCLKADKVLGLSPHTDPGGLTLLLQVNDVQGLQINKDGKWFSVNALNGALIVNIGDTLEILSNGKFRSVEHRAVVHPSRERISAALFYYPCQDMVISPLPDFVKDGKVKYKTISYQDLLTEYFTAELDGRNRLKKMKLEP